MIKKVFILVKTLKCKFIILRFLFVTSHFHIKAREAYLCTFDYFYIIPWFVLKTMIEYVIRYSLYHYI